MSIDDDSWTDSLHPVKGRSSRDSKERAGWRDPDTPRGSYESRLERRSDIRWSRFSWLTLRAMGESVNHEIACNIADFINARRNRWAAAQRAAGHAESDLVIKRTDGDRFSFLVLGDPGEQDASQYAVVEPLLAKGKGTAFMVICSDVIYPGGDVNDYVNGFYIPYKDYPETIYALPGNHDWYDGLNGFMYHFCGAEALPRTSYRLTDFNVRQLIARWIWGKAARPRRDLLLGWMAQRPPRKEHPRKAPQPGPYFAIDTGQLLIVAIDTGMTGKLDGEQGRWLLRVSRAHDMPKVLLTGKPLIVDGHYQPGEIEWGEAEESAMYTTVDDIVREPAHNYVAAIGGDIHNYQRYSVDLNKRRIEYLVAGGGGAFLSATHRIGLVDVKSHPLSTPTPQGFVPDVKERDFTCYPLRGDSLTHFSERFVPTVLQAFLWSILTCAIALLGLGMLRWLEKGSLLGDWSLWDWLLLGLSGLTVMAGLLEPLLVERRIKKGFLLATLFSASLGLGLWLVDSGSAWRWTLITFATVVTAGAATLFFLQSRSTARWLLLLAGGLGLASLLVLDATRDWRLVLIVLYTVTALLVAARLVYVLRFEARSFMAGIVGSIPGLLFVVGLWPIGHLLDGDLWWRVSVVALAALTGLFALGVLVYLLVGIGVWRLLRPSNWAGGIGPDEAGRLVRDALVKEAAENGVSVPESSERLPVADTEPSRRARRLASLMLTSQGERLSGLRNQGPFKRLVAQIFDSDEPPFFKSFLRLDVDGDRLTIRAYGVTGWRCDEEDPSLEDEVSIDLSDASRRSSRAGRFARDGEAEDASVVADPQAIPGHRRT
jgi:Calcineurin-like phosphoesterase